MMANMKIIKLENALKESKDSRQRVMASRDENFNKYIEVFNANASLSNFVINKKLFKKLPKRKYNQVLCVDDKGKPYWKDIR